MSLGFRSMSAFHTTLRGVMSRYFCSHRAVYIGFIVYMPCSSANDRFALLRLALRCFFLALLLVLDLIWFRIPVRFSSAIILLGLAICLLIVWFTSAVNRLSLPDIAINLR